MQQISYDSNRDDFKDLASVANALAKNFSDIYRAEDVALSTFYHNTRSFITLDDIIRALRGLRGDLSCDDDNILALILKDCTTVLAEHLKLLFDLVLHSETFPYK